MTALIGWPHRPGKSGMTQIHPRTNPLSREGGVGAGAFLAVAVSG